MKTKAIAVLKGAGAAMLALVLCADTLAQSAPPREAPREGSGLGMPQGKPTAPKIIHLPPAGDNSNCQTSTVVGGMHYPAQSCAQSQGNFMSTVLKSYHLTSKCPTGQVLEGASNITCQNAPIPGFSTGSVYTATACCSLPPVVISNLPMQGGNENTPCPKIGGTYQRAAAASVAYLGIMLANLDQQCGSKGPGFKLKSIKFLSCAADPRGVGFGPNASADITCGP